MERPDVEKILLDKVKWMWYTVPTMKAMGIASGDSEQSERTQSLWVEYSTVQHLVNSGFVAGVRG
jgi:hypothetical protein